ncbi:ras-like protein rasV [Haliotis rubra]|uniref:ras-like protein rasV n=1 Tax=Haliotis rubra TaxID=36100 RepID=UPI001EE51BC8|nr:ras-like protein rasV [Haliotis rubra]
MSRQVTFHSEVSISSGEDETLRLAVIGDSRVGKSTIVARLFKHWTELTSCSKQKGKTGADALGIQGRDVIVDIVDTPTKKCLSFMQRPPSCDVYVLVYSLVCDESFESAVAAREQIIRLRGPKVPIVFVANKTDIADSVDKTERVYRDLNISCEWENGHVEISAEKDTSVLPVLEQIMRRHHKYVSPIDRKENLSGLKGRIVSIKKLFSKTKRD